MWAVGLADPAGTVLGTSGLGCCDAHVPAFHTSMWHPHTQCTRSMVLPQEPSFCDPGGQGAGVVSRYLASKFGCNTEGITLSPVQAQRAAEICGPRGLSDRCKYQVRKQMQLCILPEGPCLALCSSVSRSTSCSRSACQKHTWIASCCFFLHAQISYSSTGCVYLYACRWGTPCSSRLLTTHSTSPGRLSLASTCQTRRSLYRSCCESRSPAARL